MPLFHGQPVVAKPRRYSAEECEQLIARYQWTEHQHPRARDGTFMERGQGRERTKAESSGPEAKLYDPPAPSGPEAKLFDPPAGKKTQAVPPKPQPAAPPPPSAPITTGPAKTGLERRRAKLQAKAAKNEALFAAMSDSERSAHKAEKDAKAAYKTAKKEKQPASLLDSLLAAWQGLKEPAKVARKAAAKRVPKGDKVAAPDAPKSAPAEPAKEPESPFAGWHEQTQQDRWQRHRAGDVYEAAGVPARYSMFHGATQYSMFRGIPQ